MNASRNQEGPCLVLGWQIKIRYSVNTYIVHNVRTVLPRSQRMLDRNNIGV